jgi:hypothetical protein
MRLRALLGLAVALAACAYPDFEFRTKKGSSSDTTTTTTNATTTSGGGGAGGDRPTGAGGAGGASATSAGGPQVPCKNGVVLCDSGEICCYHKDDFACDGCAAAGMCTDEHPGCGDQTAFSEMRCNGPEDCPDQVCCAYLDPYFIDTTLIYVTILGAGCQDSCAGTGEYSMCDEGSCDFGLECYSMNYLGYGFCH